MPPFGGLLLNFSFMYAGSVSSNPTLILLEALILYGWRTAGWWGLDRFLLPWLGTPWGRRVRAVPGEVVRRPGRRRPRCRRARRSRRRGRTGCGLDPAEPPVDLCRTAKVAEMSP